MDIRAQLLREHSRRNAEHIAAHIGADPERFEVLMHCVLRDDVLIGQRGAYSMNLVVEQHPELIIPYLKDLLDILDKAVHEAVHRNTIRILQYCELPKSLHGLIAGKLFAIIGDPARAIAVRAFAITAATRIVQVYPDLEREFRLLLEECLRHHPAAAIRVRVRDALKALNRLRRASQRWTTKRR